MVKYREILRLHALGVSMRNIAYSAGCAVSTVQTVIIKAKAKGLSWPLPEELTDGDIKAILYPPEDVVRKKRAAIDHEYVAKEVKRRGVTMTLLWNEYCDNALARGEEPYMLTAFTSSHRKWLREQGVSMHIEHGIAESIQVDWVGDTLTVIDPDTGEVNKAYVFVATLRWSAYTYAEAFYSVNIEAWIAAHLHAFSFFGGTTPVLVPDNCKTAVTKHAQDELVLNEEYRRMAEYYNIAVMPARVRKPRDKASVEMMVGVIERQVVAALRNKTFFDIKELNKALLKGVKEINARPFQKRSGSRESLYLGQEKKLLTPLPDEPFTFCLRKRATVNSNYHVAFERCWYSVLFQYVSREVEIVASTSSVSINCNGERIALHPRISGKGLYNTNPAHMPLAHRDFVVWDADRYRNWARDVGPATESVVEKFLASKKREQQAYHTCRLLLILGRKEGNSRLEKACEKALRTTSNPSYKTIKALLAGIPKQLDDPERYAFVRGADYYETIEKGAN